MFKGISTKRRRMFRKYLFKNLTAHTHTHTHPQELFKKLKREPGLYSSINRNLFFLFQNIICLFKSVKKKIQKNKIKETSKTEGESDPPY